MLLILRFLTLFCERREITREHGELYLVRYYPICRTLIEWCQDHLGFGVFLHEFVRPDNDPCHHSHPFKWSIGVPLMGGYYESRVENLLSTMVGIGNHIETRTKWFGPGSMNLIHHDTFHVIEELEDPAVSPTWTLFIAGPRVTRWGFLEVGVGYVDWEEHTKKRSTVPTAVLGSGGEAFPGQDEGITNHEPSGLGNVAG